LQVPTVPAHEAHGRVLGVQREDISGEQTDQGGLPRAVRAEDHDVLALAKLKAIDMQYRASVAHDPGITKLKQRCWFHAQMVP